MKLTPTLFPASDSDEVLLHGEGVHGTFVIFCTSGCENHVHFEAHVTDIHCAGIYGYEPTEMSKEKAAIECLKDLNRMIEMEVASERSSSTIQ